MDDVETPTEATATPPTDELFGSVKPRQHGRGRRRRRRRNTIIGVAVLILAVAAAALWWFVIRDDSSETTGQVSAPDGSGESGAVQLPQNPSLGASATIDGISGDEPVDLTFGELSELVVTVVNDGNVTMDDITVALEFVGADGEPDDCDLPVLSPDDSADCSLEFTPTAEMTAVVARVLGFGPQRQEVDLPVTVTIG